GSAKASALKGWRSGRAAVSTDGFRVQVILPAFVLIRSNSHSPPIVSPRGGGACGVSRLGHGLRDCRVRQPRAGVAKLVNVVTSHITGRKSLRVRIPSPAPSPTY